MDKIPFRTGCEVVGDPDQNPEKRDSMDEIPFRAGCELAGNPNKNLGKRDSMDEIPFCTGCEVVGDPDQNPEKRDSMDEIPFRAGCEVAGNPNKNLGKRDNMDEIPFCTDYELAGDGGNPQNKKHIEVATLSGGAAKTKTQPNPKNRKCLIVATLSGGAAKSKTQPNPQNRKCLSYRALLFRIAIVFAFLGALAVLEVSGTLSGGTKAGDFGNRGGTLSDELKAGSLGNRGGTLSDELKAGSLGNRGGTVSTGTQSETSAGANFNPRSTAGSTQSRSGTQSEILTASFGHDSVGTDTQSRTSNRGQEIVGGISNEILIFTALCLLLITLLVSLYNFHGIKTTRRLLEKVLKTGNFGEFDLKGTGASAGKNPSESGSAASLGGQLSPDKRYPSEGGDPSENAPRTDYRQGDPADTGSRKGSEATLRKTNPDLRSTFERMRVTYYVPDYSSDISLKPGTFSVDDFQSKPASDSFFEIVFDSTIATAEFHINKNNLTDFAPVLKDRSRLFDFCEFVALPKKNYVDIEEISPGILTEENELYTVTKKIKIKLIEG